MNAKVPLLGELERIAQQSEQVQSQSISRWINEDLTFNQVRIFNMIVQKMKESSLKTLLSQYFQKEEILFYDKVKVDVTYRQRLIRNKPNYSNDGRNRLPTLQELQKSNLNENKIQQQEYLNRFVNTKWTEGQLQIIHLRLKQLKKTQFQQQLMSFAKKQQSLKNGPDSIKRRQLQLDEQKFQLQIMEKQKAAKTQHIKMFFSFIAAFSLFIVAVAAMTITIISAKNPSSFPVPSGGSLAKAEQPTQEVQLFYKIVTIVLWTFVGIFFISGCIVTRYYFLEKYDWMIVRLKLCCECCLQDLKCWFCCIPIPWFGKKDQKQIDAI